MILITQGLDNAVDVLNVKDLSIGGVLLFFIIILIFYIYNLQKKYDLERKSFLEIIDKKDNLINSLSDERILDHRGFTNQLITIQRNTDQLVSDLKNFYSKK